MKLICAFLSFISLLGSLANAGTMQLDMRADYTSSTFDKSAEADTTRYYFKVGRFDFQAKANEDLLFRTRFAFNKNASTSVSGRLDSTQPYVELAYITHTLNDSFSMTFGKLRPGIGGFEADLSSAEHYLSSVTYSRKGPNGDLTSNLYGSSELLYMTGVRLTYNQDNQTFDVVATDEPDSAKSGPTATHNTALMGALWRGSFVQKNLNFNLSYHNINGAVKDDKFNFIGAGVQWIQSPVTFVLDYLVNDFSQESSGKKDSLNTVVGKVSYSGWEKWTPRLELSFSEEKIEVGATETHRFSGSGLVLEYRPTTDKNFRYHFAYVNTKMDTHAGATIQKQELTAGVRLLADFLK